MKGFTLIETLIYIALFTVIIGSAFSAAYALIQGRDMINSKNVVQSEINFVSRKINWSLTGVASITVPNGSTPYSNSLTVIKYGESEVELRLNGNKIEIREGVMGTYLPITTDNVQATTLQFHYIAPAGGAPAGVEASTTISGLVSTTTKYLRK